MDHLFNEILAHVSADLSVGGVLVSMMVSLLLGGIIGFTYYKTQEENYQRSMAITLLMLPIILSVIILFVGSNIARAFSLAGTLSIIRFRSAPGDPKDIGFIFFDIAAGLACGVGFYGYGALFVVLLCGVMVIAEKNRWFQKKSREKLLRITIPESLNYPEAFDEILKKYTTHYSLTKIKTTDLGSLFELHYRISLLYEEKEQELINQLRCRNGNLSIILSATDNN